MKKRIILIISVLIILAVILIIKINPKKEYHLKEKDILAIMVYDETTETYVPSSTFPVGAYDIDFDSSYCKNGSTIKSYTRSTRTVTITMSTADECYVYFVPGEPTGVDTIAALAGTTGTDGSGNAWGVVNDHGIRYVGQNPSNWVWFNCSDLTNQNTSTCERWRIIGVFNETYDTNNDGIPDTEGNLIKIIRNDRLGDYYWDYKLTGVGSSTSDYGSNDWSDSQLMMMLNPPEFINSGYVNENDASPVHSNTIDGEGYVLSDQQTPIRIYQNMGSYFNSGLTAYIPASTSTSGWSSTTEPNTSTFKKMNAASQAMIATTKWYLTGYSSNAITASAFYDYVRNTNGTGAVYNANRPKIWYGKVGLMYPSDYGYATSGNDSVNGYDRASCLSATLNAWGSGSYPTYCAYNSWLLYVGVTGNTTGTNGRTTSLWTITQNSSSAYHVFMVSANGFVGSYFANNELGIRPVLYLETSVKITGGNGSYNSPYTLSMN